MAFRSVRDDPSSHGFSCHPSLSRHTTEATNVEIIRRAEAFLARFQGVVQQTSSDVAARNRALTDLNARRGRLEQRLGKAEEIPARTSEPGRATSIIVDLSVHSTRPFCSVSPSVFICFSSPVYSLLLTCGGTFSVKLFLAFASDKPLDVFSLRHHNRNHCVLPSIKKQKQAYCFFLLVAQVPRCPRRKSGR